MWKIRIYVLVIEFVLAHSDIARISRSECCIAFYKGGVKRLELKSDKFSLTITGLPAVSLN